MRLYPFYSVRAFSNTYLLGPEGGGEAILIDPGAMDVSLLELIEERNYYVRWILITHAHGGHAGGLATVMRIYDAEILAAAPHVQGFGSTPFLDGQERVLGKMTIQSREVPGHSGDSLCFLTENCVFTGDVLGAGTLGPTPNAYARELLVRGVRDLLAELPVTTLVLPGHGPPSTVEIELATNPNLRPDLRD